MTNEHLIINLGRTLWVLVSLSSKCRLVLGLYFQPSDPDLPSHWGLNLYYFSYLFLWGLLPNPYSHPWCLRLSFALLSADLYISVPMTTYTQHLQNLGFLYGILMAPVIIPEIHQF